MCTKKLIIPQLSINRFEGAFTARYTNGYHFPGESHEMWEIDCVLCGELEITSETEIFHCKAHEAVIHPPRNFHTCYCDNPQGVEILTVSFYADGMDQMIPVGKHLLSKKEKLLIDTIKAEIEKTHNNSVFFIEEDKVSLQIIKNSVETLCLSIYSRNAKSLRPREDQKAKLFSDIAYYLKQRVDDNLNVEQICRDCGIGRTALKMLFTRFAGEGVMKYYNRLRTKRAIELIEQGYQMKTISEIMNFSSQYYFSDFFRRQTGVPPTKYHST